MVYSLADATRSSSTPAKRGKRRTEDAGGTRLRELWWAWREARPEDKLAAFRALSRAMGDDH